MKEPLSHPFMEFWVDKPAPKYWFGSHVKHVTSGQQGQVTGLSWRYNRRWSYCVDFTELGYGQWFGEEILLKP